jgi:hypothetical protein
VPTVERRAVKRIFVPSEPRTSGSYTFGSPVDPTAPAISFSTA